MTTENESEIPDLDRFLSDDDEEPITAQKVRNFSN